MYQAKNISRGLEIKCAEMEENLNYLNKDMKSLQEELVIRQTEW